MKEIEVIEEKKRNRTNAPRNMPGRERLLSDATFLECWTELLQSPKWQNKGPYAIGKHLDLLAQYPTDFATYLVAGAIQLDLPFVVTEKAVGWLYEDWKRQTNQAQRFFYRPF